jgi:hypothetical protein
MEKESQAKTQRTEKLRKDAKEGGDKLPDTAGPIDFWTDTEASLVPLTPFLRETLSLFYLRVFA